MQVITRRQYYSLHCTRWSPSSCCNAHLPHWLTKPCSTSLTSQLGFLSNSCGSFALFWVQYFLIVLGQSLVLLSQIRCLWVRAISQVKHFLVPKNFSANIWIVAALIRCCYIDMVTAAADWDADDGRCMSHSQPPPASTSHRVHYLLARRRCALRRWPIDTPERVRERKGAGMNGWRAETGAEACSPSSQIVTWEVHGVAGGP